VLSGADRGQGQRAIVFPCVEDYPKNKMELIALCTCEKPFPSTRATSSKWKSSEIPHPPSYNPTDPAFVISSEARNLPLQDTSKISPGVYPELVEGVEMTTFFCETELSGCRIN